MRSVNVGTCELDESLDRAGFRHAAASVGERLGAERLGATVYEAQAGHSIWPHHYHHAIEEWLYVVSGEPVLRDAGGKRALAAGDLICFPPGHRGAHSMSGPGRFVVRLRLAGKFSRRTARRWTANAGPSLRNPGFG